MLREFESGKGADALDDLEDTIVALDRLKAGEAKAVERMEADANRRVAERTERLARERDEAILARSEALARLAPLERVAEAALTYLANPHDDDRLALRNALDAARTTEESR